MIESDPRYPIGRFQPVAVLSTEARAARLDQLDALPAALRSAVAGLSPAQLAVPYREGGWRLAQVVHHVADSHLNAYVRCKLALTEETPTIKPYDEAAWAELADSELAPVSCSLDLVEALHRRWTALLRTLSVAEFARTVFHPQRQATMSIDAMLDLYAWHGRHHTAHITMLRADRGW